MLRYLFTLLLVLMTGPVQAQSDTTIWPLQSTKPGAVPQGWQIPKNGKAAPKWQIVIDQKNGKTRHVLAMTGPADTGFFSNLFGSGFNIITNQNVKFLNGTISVHFKAISGGTDQGGGIMWRVHDSKNYYVARFNPLEDNFRFYIVKDGSRSQLASATYAIKSGSWNVMTISQTGNQFQGAINGKKLLDHVDDTFTHGGGVGLWTKADAVTYFADFEIRPAP